MAQDRLEVDDHTKQLLKNISLVKSQPISYETIDRYETIFAFENGPEIAMSATIDEFSVKATRTRRFIEETKNTRLYSRPNTRIIAQDLPQINQYTDIYQILRGRVPGIEVTSPEPGETSRFSVIIRGRATGLSSFSPSDAARFMINGNFVSASTAESIPPSQIAFVDVISSANQLVQYGEEGVNGIVNIYLREFSAGDLSIPNIKDSDFITKKIEGFHVPQEFNITDYSDDSVEHPEFDSRTTLYWNPNLIIDDSGEATVQFYTGDRNTIYDVIVEGISESGMPVRATSEFSVTNE